MGIFGTVLALMVGLAAALYMLWGFTLVVAAKRADRRWK